MRPIPICPRTLYTIAGSVGVTLCQRAQREPRQGEPSVMGFVATGILNIPGNCADHPTAEPWKDPA